MTTLRNIWNASLDATFEWIEVFRIKAKERASDSRDDLNRAEMSELKSAKELVKAQIGKEDIEIEVRGEGKLMLINIYWETPLTFPFDYTYYLPFTEERTVQRE